MTATALTGPAPLSRVWSGPKVLAEDVVGEDLADVLDLHSGASAWWVLDRTGTYAHDELRGLAPTLDLDHLAVADLTAEDHRAKFEQTGQARLIITNVVRMRRETAELEVRPVALMVTDRALVCLADRSSDFDPARLLADHAAKLTEHGLDAAVQLILLAVIASYTEIVDWLEEATDDLSEILFAERPLAREEQLRTFRLRRLLSELRRLTEPMRGVLSDLRDSYADEKRATLRAWTLVEEKHARVANEADALREELNGVFETSLALADVQLNTIVRKLTAWAAIIAVPTLLTGFVGMNVAFPLYGTVAGFWVSLVLIVVACLVLWVAFRRRGWV